MGALGIVYYFSAFVSIEQEKPMALDLFFIRIAGISSSMAIIGILFCINNWPYSSQMLIVSLPGLLGSLVYIIYRKNRMPEQKLFDQVMMIRLAIHSLIVIAIYLKFFMLPS